MVTLKVTDFTGRGLGNRYSGKILREAVEEALRGAPAVELDFSGVEALTQSFLDEAIGVLARGKEPEVLDRLTFRSCTPEVREMLEFVENYSEYMRSSGVTPLSLAEEPATSVFHLRFAALESGTLIGHRLNLDWSVALRPEGEFLIEDLFPSTSPKGDDQIALMAMHGVSRFNLAQHFNFIC